jgi:hypothetical protein
MRIRDITRNEFQKVHYDDPVIQHWYPWVNSAVGDA